MITLHAHPVRGESHIQRKVNREIATIASSEKRRQHPLEPFTSVYDQEGMKRSTKYMKVLCLFRTQASARCN